MKKMLDMRNIVYFRYDATEAFKASGIEERVWTAMLATIVSKAGQMGIKEAKDYLEQKEKEGVLGKEITDDLFRLLDRYTKYR